GDLFLTCSSATSRNYRFGKLLSEGLSAKEAKEQIKMVVEGAYTCVSALELSREAKIAMPISEAVMQILDGKIKPKEAIALLMERSIKDEML
ncbi:MAG: glycerol-3-phosphate dehydrogenase, partial [Verrucomicrobia bacterium]|nr:glycerol-3-phosphate dehydrogenase [Verrucomicrobiota bacterium]